MPDIARPKATDIDTSAIATTPIERLASHWSDSINGQIDARATTRTARNDRGSINLREILGGVLGLTMFEHPPDQLALMPGEFSHLRDGSRLLLHS